jgi:hypothetical protein
MASAMPIHGRNERALAPAARTAQRLKAVLETDACGTPEGVP